MRFFGLEITKALPVPTPTQPLGYYGYPRQWSPLIVREPFTGAWQRNMELRLDSQLSYAPVFRCITLIANDIGKLRVKLVTQSDKGIWSEIESPAFSPVLKKPNRYQTRVQFFENWMFSKLSSGNTYALKQRDQRGLVVALYILDPCKVRPYVAPDGSVYYKSRRDDLAGIPEESDFIPASEIIHDRCNAIFHPLVGLPPLFAANAPAIEALRIQDNSTQFFANGSRPGGILTAPGSIPQDVADRLKTTWEEKFTGDNIGKVAILGDGLKYEQMAFTAEASQLIEQLKLTAEMVCTAFGVPPWKIGIGSWPTVTNNEISARDYYASCLQTHIENIEELLDVGMGLQDRKEGVLYGTEFDLYNLFRTDSATQYNAISVAIRGGFMTPNEGRLLLDLKPITGGDTVYLQEQDHSLAALAARDQSDDPFGTAKTAPPPAPPANDNTAQQAQRALAVLEKGFA